MKSDLRSNRFYPKIINYYDESEINFLSSTKYIYFGDLLSASVGGVKEKGEKRIQNLQGCLCSMDLDIVLD